MPYKRNPDGSAELSGKINEWAAEFRRWYSQDFKDNNKIDFGNYSVLLIMMFIGYAKAKWEKGFFTGSKVAAIDKMIQKNPDGSLRLTDTYAALDYLAENLKTEDRIKWSEEIRKKLVLQFRDLSAQPPKKEDVANNVQGITVRHAIQEAVKTINDSEWQIAFLSNTGVPSSVTSHHFLNKPKDVMMLSNGLAGQWVVEFFKDKPLIIFHEGREGKSYPFRRFIVTIHGATELPESSLGVPERLNPLYPDFIESIDAARSLAISENKIRFDALSVASDVRSNGACFWRFRFYDLSNGNIVNKICISGDGKNVCAW